MILLIIAGLWECIARWQDNDLLLPSFVQTARAFAQGLATGELLLRAGASLRILLQGYAAGVVVALILTSLAVSTRVGRDLLKR